MAKKTTTKKVEPIYMARWNKRVDGSIVKVGVKVKKVGNKYVALDGETEIPEWAEIVTLN